MRLPNAPMPEVDRAAASRAAVAARRARAAIKRLLEDSARSPLDVLAVASADATTAEGTLRVTDFLGALPALGATKVPIVLNSLRISPKKRLGGLGKFQRRALRTWLESYVVKRGIPNPPKLIVLAGPAGVGKGTVAQEILKRHPGVHLSVSATTRDPRPGEVDGEHYFFVSHDQFDVLISGNQLLEWATVHGINRYGTPRASVESALHSGHPVLLEIDIQGARQVKAAMPEARLVFILPPSWDELVRRLVTRGTESEEDQARRLATAQTELSAQHEFDVRVVNDEVEQCVELVVELMGLIKE